ncbi:MAG: DMT family transporter [Sulfurospirillum sp.]|nr:DMT family transporter [Sulfurospirillum sp.]
MRVYILLILCVLFWSGNFIIGRYVSSAIDPVSLAFFRWVGVVFIIAPILIMRYKKILKSLQKNFFIITLASVLGITSFNTFLYIGLQDTTAMNALLINSSIPILILILSFLIIKIDICTKQLLGIILSTIGVIYLITKGDFSVLLELQFNSGDLWVIASSLMWASYSVLLKFRPKELSDMEFFSTVVAIGTLVLGVIYFAIGSNFATDIIIVKRYYWVFIYISLFTSVLSFYFWHQGIHAIGANKTGQFTHLMPLFGFVLAYIFLKEKLYFYHLIGAAFIAIGIWLSVIVKNQANLR